MSAPPRDRRATDRRSDDRRQGDRRQGDRRRDTIAGPETVAADSRFAPREDAAEAAAPGGALGRVARIYTAARAAIGVILVLAVAGASLSSGQAQALVATLCVVYAVLAIMVWLVPSFRSLADATAMSRAPGDGARRFHWLATIGVDVITFVALHLSDHSTSFNFAALMVLPVLMAGVLMPRLMALAIAAVAALTLLFGAWELGTLAEDTTLTLARAGLGGIGFFVIAVVAGELAGRLTSEEAAARDSLELARRQAQLNRLVIQEMTDGVLVIDRSLRVRAANPAARALLVARGLAPMPPFDLRSRPAWGVLADAVESALATGRWPQEGRDQNLILEDGQARTLRVRMRFTRASSRGDPTLPADPYGVLLLEDLRTAQARIRQEKLAAMGRVSAGIAHEIRNPLAAISQANALLLEDELRPDQQRLAQMVADNVRRLQRIVDEVMDLAPAGASAPHTIDAGAVVGAVAADWARTAQLALGPDSRLRAELPGPGLGVSFDADHLRRVIVNLLDNAHRHATTAPGAIVLRLTERGASAAVLQVLSDGPAIATDVERHLFEPFFSTRSRGSGLGLYICRELCERYGASIDYRAHPGAERLRNEFVVTMRRAPLTAADPALPLTS